MTKLVKLFIIQSQKAAPYSFMFDLTMGRSRNEPPSLADKLYLSLRLLEVCLKTE